MNQSYLKILLLLFILSCSFILFAQYSFPSFAQHFQSSSYIIDWGNFNMTSGSKDSANYHLTDTVGQNAPGQYNSAGYTVKAGAQYAYDTLTPFSFAISSLNINFGVLPIGAAVTATNVITVSSPAGHGYDITASETHPLALSTGVSIPDTSCDAGTCTETLSGVWSLNTAYGFGFNALGINTSGTVTGVGTSNIFNGPTYFRQFANKKTGETPQIVMTEGSPVKAHSARVTYKALVGIGQPAGNYQNNIIFTATPRY